MAWSARFQPSLGAGRDGAALAVGSIGLVRFLAFRGLVSDWPGSGCRGSWVAGMAVILDAAWSARFRAAFGAWEVRRWLG